MFTSPSALVLIALSTIVAVFVVLYFRRSAPTEILFSLALGLFVVTGVLTPDQAWEGFANKAVIAIGGLLIISSALRTSGVLDLIGRSLLGGVTTEKGALGRLAAVVIPGSAFLLNTAIVAMLMPIIVNWCRRRNIAPSKLLIPVSYLAILGGTCTLVGTSTNFVVNDTLGNLHSEIQQVGAGSSNELVFGAGSELRRFDRDWVFLHRDQFRPMILTDISLVGVPCALAGACMLLLLGNRLLPTRREMLESLEEQRREYLVEMLVTSGCELIGKTVEEGGLRHLQGLFLIEVNREGDILAPVAPTLRLEENDRLVFTGIVNTIVELEKIHGLVPAVDGNYDHPAASQAMRSLVEVVLSPSSPLVGSSIRRANFRRLYGAAVVAVHRNGERLPTKIGDIELSAGDTLLLQTEPGFVSNFRNRQDFYLVSSAGDGDVRRPHKSLWASIIVLGLVLWLFLMPALPSWLSSVYGAEIPRFLISPEAAIFVAAMGMLVTRCLSSADARNAIDLPVLLTIGAAIGVGRGIHECGAAKLVADTLVGTLGANPYLALAVLFVVTVVLTEMISNVAVATIMIFIALSVAENLGVSPRPFIMAVTLAASLSFVSPIGYQTNLMVMGPGGYRPMDYLKAGMPLSLLVGVLAVTLIPWIWSF